MPVTNIRLRQLGIRDYLKTWRQMQAFTNSRTPDTSDELWILEHLPVYTQGLNGKPEHLLNTGVIPVVETDRGGQVTYHAPGQLIIYPLIDLRRKNLGVRTLVSALEKAAINTLCQYGLKAAARSDAPGVYVEGKKIASVGIRVKRGCSYHGMSLNVSMDLVPFSGINICGHPALEATQLANLDGPDKVLEVSVPFVVQFAALLDFLVVD